MRREDILTAQEAFSIKGDNMAKTFRKMPSFNGVAEGQTATLDLPIGLTYHGLLLTLGGTFVPANITRMLLKANGRPIRDETGAFINTANLFHGKQGITDNLLYLDFERPGLKMKGQEELTAIGTGMPANLDQNSELYNPTPIGNLQLELDISGSTNPTLSAKALQSGARPTGAIIKRRRFIRNPSGAGDYEIADLPKGDLIDKIWIGHTGNVTSVYIDRDNYRSFDRTVAENSLMQLNGIRTPQTNYYVIDMTERGNGDEMLVSAVLDFRLYVTTSDADTLTIYVDYLGGLNGN
jgi:hypothetical protein